MIRSSSKKIAITALTLATLVVNFSFAAINSSNHEFGNSEVRTTLNVNPFKTTSTSQKSAIFPGAIPVKGSFIEGQAFWVQADGQQPDWPVAAESQSPVTLIAEQQQEHSTQIGGQQAGLPTSAEVSLSNLD